MHLDMQDLVGGSFVKPDLSHNFPQDAFDVRDVLSLINCM